MALDWRKVIATSRTAQVRMAARIWGTLTTKPSPTWPRTCTVMITAATWRRGSRTFGRISGYVVPRIASVRAATASAALQAEHLVSRHVAQLGARAVGPVDAHLVRGRRGPHAEIELPRRAGEVASAGEQDLLGGSAGRGNGDARVDPGIARASGRDRQPMPAGGVVLEQHRRPGDLGDEQVGRSIAVKVEGDQCALVAGDVAAGRVGGLLEGGRAVAAKEQRRGRFRQVLAVVLHERAHALHGIEVRDAVEIHIHERGAPAPRG